ncbi:hypothetical protein LZC04_09355, partial [Campylobacter coli]
GAGAVVLDVLASHTHTHTHRDMLQSKFTQNMYRIGMRKMTRSAENTFKDLNRETYCIYGLKNYSTY